MAICAAVSREKPDSPFSLAEVARLLGLPPQVVWGALARHAHLDALDDLWVVMAPDDDWSDDRTTECLDLSLVHPEWPKQFLGHALRRWPADLIALVADLVAGVWSGDEEGFWPAAQFLAEVIDCIEPDWSMNVFVKGMMRMHGNLAVRASEMPNRGRPPHPDRDLVLQRGASRSHPCLSARPTGAAPPRPGLGHSAGAHPCLPVGKVALRWSSPLCAVQLWVAGGG